LNETLTEREAMNLLHKAGCDRKVVQHCMEVSKLAYELANESSKKGHPINLNLVKIGGLLHDIGRSKTHQVDHAAEGGEIAKNLKLPIDVIRIIERHVGAGIPKDESQKIGLPKKNYMPKTLEEKIVCYADKLIKGKDRMNFREALKEIVDDLGPNHPAVQRFIDLHQSVSRLTS